MSKYNYFREFCDDRYFKSLSQAEHNRLMRRLSLADRQKRYTIIKSVKRIAKKILTDKQWLAVRLVCFDHRRRKHDTPITDIARHNKIKPSAFRSRLRSAQIKLKKYFKQNPQLIENWKETR